MAKFSTRRMKKSCLRCHGNPKDAPSSLLKKYGATAGFYRPVGRIIGLDTVAIPMKKIYEQLWSESMPIFLVSGLSLLFFFLVIIYTTRLVITNRLSKISKHFVNAAQQEDYSNINPIKIKGRDEIFDLAFSFNTLTDKLKDFYTSLDQQVKERTRELVDKNQLLQVEIAERKQAEEALKNEKKRFQILVEESPLGISLMAKDATYKYVNPKFVEMFGYTVEDIPSGREWFRQAYPQPDYRKKVISSWIREMEASKIGEFGPHKFNVRCKNGSDKFINFRAVAMETGDQLIIYEDITEKKHLETQLQQVQKMEALGTLAGGIAHDFNNILTSVIGYTELALDDAAKGTLQHENLREILKAGNRATELVKQILTFSRQVDQEQKPIQVKSIIKEALKLLRASIPSTIEIKHNIQSNSLVMGDSTQIH
jgi:two-component system, cell cycle sensor histidine kinase and response regulator CckA